MRKILPLILLLPLACQAARAKDACETFQPDPDPKLWTWLDRECREHTRAEFDAVLARHQQWLKKYDAVIGAQLKAHPDQVQWRTSNLLNEVLKDPLRADLSGATLIEAKAVGADLTGANLKHTDLTNADLFHASLRGADLGGVDLTGATLWNANIEGALIYSADLSGSNMYQADLRGAAVNFTDLTNADLHWALLDFAEITGTDLSNADLTEAWLRNTVFEPQDPTHTRQHRKSAWSAHLTLERQLSGCQWVFSPHRVSNRCGVVAK